MDALALPIEILYFSVLSDVSHVVAIEGIVSHHSKCVCSIKWILDDVESGVLMDRLILVRTRFDAAALNITFMSFSVRL